MDLPASSAPLSADFFRHPPLEVARGLLGKRLVRLLDGVRLGGIITEAEAYDGEQDQACHASHGFTPRTRVMYGAPGIAYIYFTYGMHWMLNAVAAEEGYPAAALIRAIRPLEGLQVIAARRPDVKPALWCNGPGKLTRALGIDGALNGASLCSPQSGLWIEDAPPVEDGCVRCTPRIGIQSVPEPWLSKPWRFLLDG